MSLPTEHFFVLKPDGKIYWVDTMPDSYFYVNNAHGWRAATLSAIDNAVEVSNQEEVKARLLLSGQHRTHGDGGELKAGLVYSLQCSVEKIVCEDACQNFDNDGSISICRNGGCAKAVALVTFSEPEPMKETQEELIRTIIDMALNRGFRAYELAQHFTITRKK